MKGLLFAFAGLLLFAGSINGDAANFRGNKESDEDKCPYVNGKALKALRKEPIQAFRFWK